MQIENVTIIGAGNISWHLSQAIHKAGIKINQIYSRDLNKANSVAQLVNAQAINSIKAINSSSDLILICVSDKAIKEVISSIQFEPKLIAHTAGSVPISVFEKFSTHGILYPLQTFTKGININLKQTPFCIEANNQESKILLTNLAGKLTDNIYELNSEQRLQCHIAAVFANNFANHMYNAAEKILAHKNIPFDILKPIIMETAKKVQSNSPTIAQTGPASRNDTSTIEAHLKLLTDPEMEKLYSFVSQNIWKLKQQNN